MHNVLKRWKCCSKIRSGGEQKKNDSEPRRRQPIVFSNASFHRFITRKTIVIEACMVICMTKQTIHMGIIQAHTQTPPAKESLTFEIG